MWAQFLLLLIKILQEKTNDKIEIYLFHSDHCKACIHFNKEVRPKIETLYGHKIYFTEFDVDQQDDYEKLTALAQLNSKKASYPAIYIGRTLLVGNKEIDGHLATLIEVMIKKNIKTENVNLDTAKSINDIFTDFSVLAIAGAGLLDGINPCAFTVVIFFVSFLAVYGYRRKELLLIGISYICAVFFAYLGIGIGLFNFLYSLSSFYVMMRIFYSVMAVLCFVLGILCLLDFFKFNRTGSTDESFLQLPKIIKKRIQKIIGDEFRLNSSKSTVKLCLGAFTVGLLVSLLEAVCTGQVYLPVISFVLRQPGLRLKAGLYLVLYNLMFIIPLIVVFVLTLCGVASSKFADYYKQRFGFIRFCMFLLFIGLGLFMLGS